MRLGKQHRNSCIFLILILWFGYRYFRSEGQLMTSLRWFQKTQQLTKTYPTFHHPMAPPYPYPYRFIFSQADKCKDRNPFLVIMVVCEVNNIESRNGIRNTWGNLSLYDADIVRIFLVGLSKVDSDRTQKVLEGESSTFGDIVQQDFMDTYSNLTLKTLMGIEWVNRFCLNASYVMKIDNDVFLNVDYLVHKFLHPELPVRTNFFTGCIVNGTHPLRSLVYRARVPKEVYPNDTYPPYCAGPGYLFSVDMAKKIYDISQVIQVIPVEDAFMGICLHELKIPPTKSPPGIFNCQYIPFNRCRFHRLVTVHHYDYKDVRLLWEDFLKGCSKNHLIRVLEARYV